MFRFLGLLFLGILYLILGASIFDAAQQLAQRTGAMPPWDRAGAFLVLALAFWLFFRLLDRLHTARHHGLGEPSVVGVEEATLRPPVYRTIITALRTGALCLALPLVSVALLIAACLPVGLLWSSRSPAPAIVAEVLFLWLLGLALEIRYLRAAAKLMRGRSGSMEPNGGSRTPGAGGKPLRRHLIDAAGPVAVSEEAAVILTAGARRRRLDAARAVGAPLVALAAVLLLTWIWRPPFLEAQRPAWMIGLSLAWGLVLLVERGLVRLRLADRTPFRQLRLGGGVVLISLVIAPLSLLRFPQLVARSETPLQQWMSVASPVHAVSRYLRSASLLWGLAALLLPTGILALGSGLPTWSEGGPWILASFTLASAGYTSASWSLTHWLRRRRERTADLIFLRVFGDRRRGRFLFERLVPAWRGIGGITCIAAPDVSIHQLNPDAAIDALFGQLRGRFIADQASLEAAAMDALAASGTGRAVAELPCFEDTWKVALERLFVQNAVVLMDLRGFSTANRGCTYEIGALIDSVPLGAVVFLVDATTDVDFFERIVQDAWGSMSKYSPNSGSNSAPLTLFRIATPNAASARKLVLLLCAATSAGAAYNREAGRPLRAAIIESLHLLAAEFDVQQRALPEAENLPRTVLKQGLSFDPDLDAPGYLLSWDLITQRQYEALLQLSETVRALAVEDATMTLKAMKEERAWHDLRAQAREVLRTFDLKPRPPRLDVETER